MMNDKIEQIRKEYTGLALKKKDLLEDPIQMFLKWLESALSDKLFEPHAMTLSTTSLQGKPNSRTVLLKDVADGGFIFVTNCLSTKGLELSQNPDASLTFWFREHYRQVNIQGHVIRLSKEKSEKYFSIRPRGSQIAAWIPQSQVVESREVIEKQYQELENSFAVFSEIPCPHTWCAYRLDPERVEFWQGRENRLHDRFEYTKQNSQWMIRRLSP